MKKFLSIALALLMVCVMLPVVALAADTLPAPDANGVITLTEDVTLSDTLQISSDTTIDLNGKKLTITNKTAVYITAGTFTVKDSGTNGEMALDGTISVIMSNMKLEGGTISFNKAPATLALVSGNFEMTGGMVCAAADGTACFNPGYFGTSKIDIKGGVVKGASASTAVIGCGDGEFKLDVDVSGDAVVDVNHELINGEGSNNVAFDIVSGTFTGKVDAADIATRAGGNLVVSDGNKFYVGATATATVESATSGTFTVVNGTDVNLTVKGGVTVKNGMDEGTVTVNGKTLEVDKEYTAPTVIIISGDTTPTETPKTEDQKNPSTGANDFVGLAAAAAVVALLGSAVVLRKK